MFFVLFAIWIGIAEFFLQENVFQTRAIFLHYFLYDYLPPFLFVSILVFLLTVVDKIRRKNDKGQV